MDIDAALALMTGIGVDPRVVEALNEIRGEMEPVEEIDEEYVSRCPACGDVIDYCQGHGEIGDPVGWEILQAHDDGDHSGCDPEGCDEAGTSTGPKIEIIDSSELWRRWGLM